MRYAFNEELINQILNYLATKPYAEVFQLVNKIQQEAEKLEGEKSNEN